jgi:WD40 repeat protein
LRVWNLETGEEDSALDKDLLPSSNLAVTHGAEKLAVIVNETRCRLWDLRTGKEQTGLKLTTGPVAYGPEEIMLSDDGKLLATYHTNSHVSVWEVATQLERCRIQIGTPGMESWAFSDDGKLLVTAQDGVISTWSMADGKKVGELRGHRSDSGIIGLAVSPEDGGLVSTCTECTVLRWQKSAWQGK